MPITLKELADFCDAQIVGAIYQHPFIPQPILRRHKKAKLPS